MSAVAGIVDAWRRVTEPDERIKEWINRMRWDRFIDGYFFGSELARSHLRFGW